MLTQNYAAPPREKKPAPAEDRASFRENFSKFNNTPQERQKQADEHLERVIESAHTLFTSHPTPARWRRLCRLICARSPAMVLRLEVAKGLAPRGAK